MIKVALTSRGPYTGATSLASYLEIFDCYQHISMSEFLIVKFAETHGLIPAVVTQNKAEYRLGLQKFAEDIGFSTSTVFLDQMLATYNGISDLVVEKVRTNEQASYLRDNGFKIVNLYITQAERERRAAGLGVEQQALSTALAHPIEQGIDADLIDIDLFGEGSTVQIAHRYNHLYELL
jgi:hypothetical protein